MQLLISAGRISERLDDMATAFSRMVSPEREILVLVVMDGALMLAADLVRRLRHPVRLAFIKATSYRQGTVAGKLELDLDGMPSVTGCDVLLVDDILDSGQTLSSLYSTILNMNPKSLSTLVLLQKDLGRPTFQADMVGFNVPDEFVVGYGMDWAGHLRHLPGVMTLSREDLALSPVALAKLIAGENQN